MLRRGFKKEAHALAREVRADLGLTPVDPLDPFALASLLEIPVYSLSDLRDGAAEAVRHLTKRDPSAFSAVTIFEGLRKTIWHNDGHALVRQRSNVAHELAHALLFHTPGSDPDPVRARPWDKTAEEEAQWLGGALLVSYEAALALARAGSDTLSGAGRYGVSTEMLTYRLNVTGALIRAARSKRRNSCAR
jgi:Zn-dependent peptidase ImmA (M78 family)